MMGVETIARIRFKHYRNRLAFLLSNCHAHANRVSINLNGNHSFNYIHI